MEMSMYLITTRLIKKLLTQRIHGYFHVPYVIVQYILYTCPVKILYLKNPWKMTCTCQSNIKTGFTGRVIGNFHAPCNLETNSTFSFQKRPWKFSCTRCYNIWKLFKRSMEISFEGFMKISMYPKSAMRIIYKYVTITINIATWIIIK